MPPEVWATVGPWGLLLSVVGMLITSMIKGWLRPQSSVQRENKHLEERLTDRDDLIKELKAANAALMKTNETNARTIRESLEIGRTSNAALTALPRLGAEVEAQ